MENILDKLEQLGLLRNRIILSDNKLNPRLRHEMLYPDETLDVVAPNKTLKGIISRYYTEKAYEFVISQANIDSPKTNVLSTINNFSIDKLPAQKYDTIINLNKINDIRRINKFFELVNSKLPHSGVYIGYCETLEQRYKRYLKKYPFLLNRVILLGDYVFKRIMPKIPLAKKIYFNFTGGRNRVISRAETLGRLYSCGFRVIKEETIGNVYYFAVRKTSKPAYDPQPSYGMFFPMKRTGKNGKAIRVYKFRTMYPFSEYLQPYIYEKNNLDKTGKFKNDFRVTCMGRFMRMCWLDELPMLLNLFKGELKLVGIRPLSKHFQSLYPDDLVEMRKKTKPGLVPPFYADMPRGLDEIVESEKRYLEAYQKSPLKTDFIYFWKAFKNIVFHRARSK